jgi:AcrR family transcriptional regulator
MPRKSKDRARAIAAVALDLFAERDFSTVTLKDIASRAGINPALVYYYFEDKEDLFRFSIESAIFAALDHYGRIDDEHEHPVDLINGWFDNNLALSRTIANLLKIKLDYSRSRLRLRSVDRLIRKFYEDECRILADAISKGVARRLFRKIEAERLALFVSSHLDGIMVASIIRPGFDLAGSLGDLRALLFEYLAPPRRAKTRKPQRRRK